MNEKTVAIDNEELVRHIIGALRRVKPAAVGDDTESLDASLLLGADLGLSSLELVRLAGALQRELGWVSIGFHRLFINADGSFAADVSIGRLAAFLAAAQPGS